MTASHGGRTGPADDRRARGRTRRFRFGALVAVVLAAAAFAVISSRPTAPPRTAPTGAVAQAARAIDDLLDPRSGRDPIAALPADFTAVTGVSPQRLPAPDGTTRAVHVNGGCSSPWGDDNTRWDYSVGCKAHDLGYDLLRYADAKGRPLGPDLRERLDDQLSRDMHAQCVLNPRGSPRTCELVASLYSVGLVVNSWHQRWGPPRAEPIGVLSLGLLVLALLIAVRVPSAARARLRCARHRPVSLTTVESARTGFLGVLMIASLAGIVLAESLLALTSQAGQPAGWVWPLTWLLQLVPVFFLAGGHANLLAWRAAGATGGGFGDYLAERIGTLLRPVLAFVTAWLIVPLSLELLQAPEQAIATFGRIVLQPLWLLGLYLLVVAATPATHWLHRSWPLATPVTMLAATVGLGWVGTGSLAAHTGGIAVALLFQQLAFHYADGTLWRIRRPVLLGGAVGALLGLVALTTVGGQAKLLIAEPTEYASFVPSLLGVLLIGLAQVCLVALPHESAARRFTTGVPARAAAVVRRAPMTAYLFFLCAMLLLNGVIGAADRAGLPTSGVDWLARPRTLLAFALLGVPALLVFLLFERPAAGGPAAPAEPAEPPGHRATRYPPLLDALAAGIGVGFGVLGVLGFAVTGITGAASTPIMFGLPFDPMTNLIHLLVGWHLLHTVRVRAGHRPAPWLLVAVACVPPMLTTVGGPGMLVHGAVLLGALAAAVLGSQPVRWRRATQPASEAGTP